MCGLLGWAGKDPKDFNRSKFNILGIANESRGTHSCGVSTDGELFKGVGLSNKKYTDFIINSYYEAPKEIPVVIGHTRYATGGAHTKENAHPFRFNNGDDFLVGAHNGVIKNIPALCKKYNVVEGNRIDSEVLLDIISQDNLDVLEEYEGAAALLMYSSNNPNTMWVFKGESKEFRSSTSTTEERPLFYYQENENSMYISSLKDSLIAIVNEEKEKDESIKEFLTNTLYKIVDGSIEKRYVINREGRYQKYVSTVTPTNNYGYEHHHSNYENGYGYLNAAADKNKNSNRTTSTNNTASVRTVEKNCPSSTIKSHKTNNIFYEKLILTDIELPIYYENLQYKRNGHPVTGVYIFIKETGLVELCSSVSSIESSLKNFNYFDKKADLELKFGDITDEVSLFYIHNGFLLKDLLDYKRCISSLKGITNTEYSYMSAYPVIDHSRLKNNEKIYPTSQRIKSENSAYSGILKPIGSFCEYDISLGDLRKITEHADFFTPDQSKFKILEAFKDAEWVDVDDDESVFEEGLSNELFSKESNSDDIDNIININNVILNSFTKYNKILDDVNEEIAKSNVVKSFKEFCKDSMDRYKPISDNIKLWEKQVESNT